MAGARFFTGCHRRLMFSLPISLNLLIPLDSPSRWPLKTTDETFLPSTSAISALL